MGFRIFSLGFQGLQANLLGPGEVAFREVMADLAA
jgi:hypothetical protein